MSIEAKKLEMVKLILFFSDEKLLDKLWGVIEGEKAGDSFQKWNQKFENQGNDTFLQEYNMTLGNSKSMLFHAEQSGDMTVDELLNDMETWTKNEK